MKLFPTIYIKETQLVNMDLNVEEIANSKRINDLLINESTIPLPEVRDKPRPLTNERLYREHKDEKDIGQIPS